MYRNVLPIHGPGGGLVWGVDLPDMQILEPPLGRFFAYIGVMLAYLVPETPPPQPILTAHVCCCPFYTGIVVFGTGSTIAAYIL